MVKSFKLEQPPAVIARHEAISRIACLIYHRGASLVITTVESSGLGREIASSFLLAMTAEDNNGRNGVILTFNS